MYAFLNHVKRRLLILLILHIYTSLSIKVHFQRHVVPNIVAKTKLPLTPINVPCFLNDMVRISVPFINELGRYYLSRPNGDAVKLNISLPTNYISKKEGRKIVTTYIGNATVISDENNYSAFKVTEYETQLKKLAPNEFIVGPLLEEDYGNWVLSIYSKDIYGDWIEFYQVITMSILEYTLLEPRSPILKVGDTFNVSFAYPYQDLETCEISAPRTTFDRYFSRSFSDYKKCGYNILSITKDDEGIWIIVGFGRILYQGDVRLVVIDPHTQSTLSTGESSINQS